MLCIDADNLHGFRMSQYLPFDETKFDKNVELEDFLNNLDHSYIG